MDRAQPTDAGEWILSHFAPVQYQAMKATEAALASPALPGLLKIGLGFALVYFTMSAGIQTGERVGRLFD